MTPPRPDMAGDRMNEARRYCRNCGCWVLTLVPIGDNGSGLSEVKFRPGTTKLRMHYECDDCGDAAATAEAAERDTPLESFPFTRPAGSDADMFIQWKGTKVCLDFHCQCGYHGHLDDAFAYYVSCGVCGAVYEMGTQVIARRLADGEKPAGDPRVAD